QLLGGMAQMRAVPEDMTLGVAAGLSMLDDRAGIAGLDRLCEAEAGRRFGNSPRYSRTIEQDDWHIELVAQGFDHLDQPCIVIGCIGLVPFLRVGGSTVGKD